MTRLAGVRRSFPTLTMPFRWIGKSRRRIWVASLILLAMVMGPPVWWTMQLLGLTDVGDPFDVQAFQAFTIPAERNAYVLYHQAATLLKPWDQFRKTIRQPANLRDASNLAGSLVDGDPGTPCMGRAEPRGAGRLPPGQRTAGCTGCDPQVPWISR